MIKKILTTGISLLMFFTLAPIGLAHEYEDVPSGSDYFFSVDYLRRNDVFKDTRFFGPETLISKAEFVKYLVILNSPDFKTKSTTELPFKDTQNNAWYASYFAEAIKLGILDDRNETVEPNEKLTVIDALTLLFHSQSIPIPNVYRGSIPYTDVKRNTQAAPLIMRALELRIIEPAESDNVGIYRRVNRAQAAKMIYLLDLAAAGSLGGSSSLPSIGNYGSELQKIIAVWESLEGSYLEQGSIDRTKLADSALKAMIDALNDPYSVYLDTEANGNFNDSISGELEGIGAVIGYNENDLLSIITPLGGSPAERAGLKAKDVIIEVDGEAVSDLDIHQVVSLIKGPRGTSVKIKVSRSGSLKTITVVRDLIVIESLEHEQMENGVHYIKLAQFNNDTAIAFDMLAEDILSNPSSKGILLDLRGNPGGVLGVTITMMGHFVPAQEEVVSIHYKDYTQVLLSRGSADLAKFPLVILIDEGSASASEIVAGTLQDYELATIVGEPSFGKGTVQELTTFYDNSSLKLTIARWLTPEKQDIAKNGIIPDIRVTEVESTDQDEQFDRALSELLKKLN